LKCVSNSAIEEEGGIIIGEKKGTGEGDKKGLLWREEDVKGGYIIVELRLTDSEEKGWSSVFSGAWVPSRGKHKVMALIFIDGLTTKQFENMSQLTFITSSCGSSRILRG
jgi:hypothetical protein